MLTLILLILLITSILCTTRKMLSVDILDIGSYSGSMCGCLGEILTVGSVDDSA